LLCGTASALVAGPTIEIVVRADAHQTELLAADETAALLKKLFDADVHIARTTPPPDAQNVIYLGSIYEHPVGENVKLPNVGAGGHFAKSMDVNGKPALVLGGAGTNATLWAAYQLGWHYGVRYFPFGDLYPIDVPQFTTTGVDVVIAGPTSPYLNSSQLETERFWVSNIAGPLGTEAWSSAEQLQKYRYFATAKFNRIFSYTPNAWTMTGREFPVSGETAGRAAFQGAKFFDNPDLAGIADPAARQTAAEKLRADVYQAAGKFNFQYRHGGREPPRVNLLPCMFHNELHRQQQVARPKSPAAIHIDVACLDDAVLAVAYARQRAFDPKATPATVCKDLLTPVTGPEVHVNVLKAFDLCEAASVELKRHPEFQKLDANLLLQHTRTGDPPPAWWGQVRTNYLNAMNEMYRANTRAREGGRAFTLYYARRFEFGFEYMNVVEALRKAAIAKKAGKQDEQIAELEKALDSLTNACNAMAAVARSQSDRGVIAVMNEYGYRPVMKLLEDADGGN
jgi:hypothetical protein